MSHPDTVALTGDHGLGTVRTMPQFRTHIAQGPLTDAQRRLVLDQAEILIEEIYVHLPLKRAMHAVDPLQALRLLRHRLAELTETEFHVQLQRIFLGLHDLHTNYILPSRYAGFAFLGIFLERCVDAGRTAYVVTKTFDHITGDPQLKAGVEVTHWNGTPIQLAVEANAAREAGSNKAAQLAQGLQNMTLRSINMSLPPDEDWVDITYKVDGATHETRVPWRVFESGAEVTTPGTLPSLPTGVEVDANHLVGMDLRTELTRRVKRRLFAPASLQPAPASRAPRRPAPASPGSTAPLAAGPVPTNRPDELKARIVDTPSGTFGHLRIFTFHMQDQNIDALPQRGHPAALRAAARGPGARRPRQRRWLRDRGGVPAAVPQPAPDHAGAVPVREHAGHHRTRHDRRRLRGLEGLARGVGDHRFGVLHRLPALPGRRRQQRRPGLPGPGRAGDRRAVLQRLRHLRRRLPGPRDRPGARRRGQHRRRRRERRHP